jgi:hypothetical protein
MPGSILLSAWLSAPAFRALFPTEVMTLTPIDRAISAVRSVQLSQTTVIDAGGIVCLRSDLIVSAMEAASLWAGISTVTCW